MKRNFDYKVFLSHASQLSGIYQMLDENGVVLYVGKAKNLQKRLSSYFQTNGLSFKTQKLMAKVFDIQTTITANETEAYLLENNLIKSHRPRFNILLRDDKSYPYLTLSRHEFPKLSFYRGRRQHEDYYGPYPNAQMARNAMTLLQKIFRVRQCEDSFFASRSRPCMQYHINNCYAPCVGLISKQDYAQTVANSRAFLSGKSEKIQQDLQEKMQQASLNQEYEKAAHFRDQLIHLRGLFQSQNMIFGQADIDIFAICKQFGAVCVQLIFYRDGHNTGSQAFYPQVFDEQEENSEILRSFIAQFYINRPPPPIIITSESVEDCDELANFLSNQLGKKVHILVNPKGQKKKLLDMANVNAQQNLQVYLAGKLSMQKRFEQFAKEFNLPKIPNRIECVDVSHTQGTATIASCVVFDERGAVKSAYRRFKIEDITKGDDYAALYQVVKRRFERLKNNENNDFPDVFLIDGGRGQVKMAIKVLQELKISNVLLIGVAKGEGRKAGLEKFFINDAKTPFFLDSHSLAMQLILQIRDEAHRFALIAHRANRSQKSQQSKLQQISGVGAKRRQALLKYFGGLSMIEQASIDDLAKVEGISYKLAEHIYHHLHKG